MSLAIKGLPRPQLRGENCYSRLVFFLLFHTESYNVMNWTHVFHRQFSVSSLLSGNVGRPEVLWAGQYRYQSNVSTDIFQLSLLARKRARPAPPSLTAHGSFNRSNQFCLELRPTARKSKFYRECCSKSIVAKKLGVKSFERRVDTSKACRSKQASDCKFRLVTMTQTKQEQLLHYCETGSTNREHDLSMYKLLCSVAERL